MSQLPHPPSHQDRLPRQLSAWVWEDSALLKDIQQLWKQGTRQGINGVFLCQEICWKPLKQATGRTAPLRIPGFSLGLGMVAGPHLSLGSPNLSSSWSPRDASAASHSCQQSAIFRNFWVSVTRPDLGTIPWLKYRHGELFSWILISCRRQESAEWPERSHFWRPVGHIFWGTTLTLHSFHCCCHSWCVSQLSCSHCTFP